MKLTDAMWHLLQKIPKVSGFIGKYRDHRPESVPDSQIHNIKQQIHWGKTNTRYILLTKLDRMLGLLKDRLVNL